MAQIISIGATQHIDLLKSRLGRETKPFERNGLVLNLEEKPAGQFTFLNCFFADFRGHGQAEIENQNLLKTLIAEVISDLIVSHWEAPLLRNIIRENYYYFAEEDKEAIFSNAVLHINNNANRVRKPVHRFRKNEILHKITEFLMSNNFIVIDGFIRFRLKEYVRELKEAADRAADEFLMEREYKEFIQLLKYFVEAQEPRLAAIHVLTGPEGDFKLYDDNLKPVNDDHLGGFFVELINDEINCEDLLVSALVAIAPKEVIFHYTENRVSLISLETIKSVFGNRVRECTGCTLCSPHTRH